MHQQIHGNILKGSVIIVCIHLKSALIRRRCKNATFCLTYALIRLHSVQYPYLFINWCARRVSLCVCVRACVLMCVRNYMTRATVFAAIKSQHSNWPYDQLCCDFIQRRININHQTSHSVHLQVSFMWIF